MRGIHRIAYAFVLALSVGAYGCGGQDTDRETMTATEGKGVSVIVESVGNLPEQREKTAAGGESRTVLSVLEELKEKKRIEYIRSGTGEMVFIESLHGIANQGRNGKNWMYAVDGKMADLGVARMRVKPGGRVRWCFVSYEERSRCASDIVGSGASR